MTNGGDVCDTGEWIGLQNDADECDHIPRR